MFKFQRFHAMRILHFTHYMMQLRRGWLAFIDYFEMRLTPMVIADFTQFIKYSFQFYLTHASRYIDGQ
jgi:hypothetical protein